MDLPPFAAEGGGRFQKRSNHMTDATNPGYQLASALEAIRKEEEAFASLKRDHKDRMENLHSEVAALKLEILTGQKRLPLEPTPEVQEEIVAETTQLAKECMAELAADELLEKAVLACKEKGQASVKDLREWFGIQTGRAVALIDAMDAQGLLKPANGSGPREIA